MKYLVIYQQQDDGCDYTIGCGTLCVTVEADSEAALVERIGRDLFEDGGLDHHEQRIKSARCVPLGHVSEVDLPRMRGVCFAYREAARATEVEAAELAELQRLQAKYNGGR